MPGGGSWETPGLTDALAARAYIQGALIGVTLYQLRESIVIRTVEQDLDGDGNYLPHFTVVTGSGHRIKVTVELQDQSGGS